MIKVNQQRGVGEMKNYITFKDVKKVYKMGEVEIEALSGVNFSIDKGEFVVVAGASGAGKSTVLNILGGMDTASSGTISVGGNEISNYNNKELITYRRHDIGFVFQFYNLVQNLTAIENVELATQICENPLDVHEVLEAVGLGNTGKAILKLLQDTCRNMGMTVVMITHNLAIAPMGDKVIHVRNGKVSSIEINENPTPVERIEW